MVLKAQIAKWSLISALKHSSGSYVTNLRPSKSHNFKIQAQESNKVHLFEEMTNASIKTTFSNAKNHASDLTKENGKFHLSVLLDETIP